MSLFISLLLAHLLGDFLLQPSQWVADKERNKIKSKYLYAHILIHFLLLLLLTRFNTKHLFGITFIVVSHFAIDLVKLYLQKPETKKIWFFTDQLLHLLMIVVWCSFEYKELWTQIIQFLYAPETLWFFCCLLLTTYVTSIVQKIILSRWIRPFTEEENKPSNNAGTFIGILERLFIFLFIWFDVWSGVGFLLAAKTIFRIGDLTRAKDYAITEYILIGTFLSFGFGISFALLFKFILIML